MNTSHGDVKTVGSYGSHFGVSSTKESHNQCKAGKMKPPNKHMLELQQKIRKMIQDALFLST